MLEGVGEVGDLSKVPLFFVLMYSLLRQSFSLGMSFLLLFPKLHNNYVLRLHIHTNYFKTWGGGASAPKASSVYRHVQHHSDAGSVLYCRTKDITLSPSEVVLG